MKDTLISLKSGEEQLLATVGDDVTLDKKVEVSVPSTHTAYVFVNQSLFCRIDADSEKKMLWEIVGKEYLNSKVRVAFVAKTPKKIVFNWGFGNINVNNSRLVEAYRIGANGECSVSLIDAVQLLKYFASDKTIDVEKIRLRLLSTIKTVGVPILGGYFANTDISVFEIDSKVKEIREKMFAELGKEKEFGNMGLILTDLTVSGLHVNEDDLASIRSRINE